MKFFAVILASGKGNRFVSDHNYPKQFMDLAGKTVLERTITQFLNINQFTHHIVVANPDFLDLTLDICTPLMEQYKNISVIEGDIDRQGSVLKALEHLQTQFHLHDQDVVVTHDAVRPLIFKETIEANITSFEDESIDAVDTAIPLVDTPIKICPNTQILENVLPRDHVYRGQTPQSFRYGKLFNWLKSMTLEERLTLTDAIKPLTDHKARVKMVMGHILNMKITTYEDYQLLSDCFNYLKDRLENYGTYYL